MFSAIKGLMDRRILINYKLNHKKGSLMKIFLLNTNLFFLILLLLTTGCSIFGIQSEESPTYSIVHKDQKYEIRDYSSYIIAKTTVKANFKDASKVGFKILAGYIFGDNTANQKLSETSPTLNSQKVESTKIPMTAPVTMTSQGSNEWTMSFSMPRKYNLASLPKPNDRRISLETVPKKLFAAISYSGSFSVNNNSKQAEILKSWIINKTDYEIKSQATYAGYNPPWTIPVFKKNEVLIEVSKNPKN